MYGTNTNRARKVTARNRRKPKDVAINVLEDSFTVLKNNWKEALIAMMLTANVFLAVQTMAIFTGIVKGWW